MTLFSIYRKVPPKKPDNSHLVDCGEMTPHNKFINRSSRCGAEVIFGKESRVSRRVTIGYGSEFGEKLNVGMSTQIGNFVLAGKEVTIEEFGCVEDKTSIPAGTTIEKYTMAGRDSKGKFKKGNLIKGMRYVLKGGHCVPEPLYVIKT